MIQKAYQVAGFTHKGTNKSINEDAILVKNSVLQEGFIFFSNNCNEGDLFFVADGVGGNPDGHVASRFVLEKLLLLHGSFTEKNDLLKSINDELLLLATQYPGGIGPATTLSGCVIDNDKICLIHAGDSQIYLFRNGYLLKQTIDHVYDDLEVNSPITSYLGGSGNYLKPDINSTNHLGEGESLLICTDGILKSITSPNLIEILSSMRTNEEKILSVMKICLEKGADDNISAILLSPIIAYNE